MLNGFFLCLQFFTVIPIHKEIKWEKRAIEGSLLSLPFIGVLIGSFAFFQYYVLTTYSPFPITFIALWIMFYFIAVTGGLHIDGWMDCSDAFFSYRDREKRLQIMEDPRVGSFAVLSVLFLLAFRLFFLYEVLNDSFLLASSGLILVSMFTRGMIVLMLVKGRLAKATGLAAAYQKEAGPMVTVRTILVIAFLLCIVTLILSTPIYTFTLVGASILFGFIFYRFCINQFGGVNGDTLGALLEGGETFLWFVLWLLLYFVTE